MRHDKSLIITLVFLLLSPQRRLDMIRIFSIIFTIASGVLMGCFIIIALVLGQDTAQPIIYAALAGLLVAVPISWLIASKVDSMQPPN